jgi:hypothetical protein
MKILSFDPGGSTGWASFETLNDGSSHHFDGGTFVIDDHHKDIRQLITDTDPDLVIYETFEFRQSAGKERERKGLNLISREYIGIIKLTTADLNIKTRQQPPAYKDTNLVRDDNLKKLGLLRFPLWPNRHYHDAARHLAHYLIQQERNPQILEMVKRK